MAITEKYVTVTGAGALNGTSEANAWTLALALTNAVAGDRVNIKAGTYTLAANMTPVGAGTVVRPIIWRGYNTTIGDLSVTSVIQDPKTLKLTTTNFPLISGGGSWACVLSTAYNMIEALKFTATGLNNGLVRLTGIGCSARLCSATQTSDIGGSRCFEAATSSGSA
jgi:hypothetical protein